ncbi:LysR family transcriptional regulator [Bradyrhizobium prioriisuperbiae]|uniref:LysR family transcriptional regulator n=1 Tax=Bradyrhizobium prioriisuperbiae TaxID=2854389 RepID=UPI0028E7CCF6|nr:LysR family transcriptional regulator [Bradyrhizobium prioritasuperba]
MPMNITIRQIQSFLHVAELGSFTRAAEKMHTMQPALSQQVRDLEAELGIRLFDRTTRRVELTEGGAEFRNIAAKIIEDLEAAARNAHDLAERKRGRVTVAAPPLLAAAIVPRAIADFHRKYPGLQVKLIDARTDQIVEHVRSGQVDCGIGTFHAGESEISSTLLARDSLMVFCTTGHALAGKPTVGWRDLDGLPLITLTRDSGIRLLVEVGFEAAQIRLVPAYEVGQITTALAMVEAGLGVAVLPTYAWSGARGMTISAVALLPRITRDIVMITRTGRSIAPAVSAFARYLGKYTTVSAATAEGAKPSSARKRTR